MATMGERIFQKRKELGMTMEELGARLGVNKTAVNKWEKGIVQNVKQSTIKQMADIFGCTPSWLMGFDDVPVPRVENVEQHVELIRLFDLLSAEQQEAIIHMMHTMAGC